MHGLLRKLQSIQPIYLSMSAVLLGPAIIFLLAILTNELTRDIEEVEVNDVLGELWLLILVQFWIITIALSHLKPTTYLYLLCGFALITVANTADLLDEFITSDSSWLKTIENYIYPLGMTISTFGLFKLGSDHKALIRLINKERDSWKFKANTDKLTGLLNRRAFENQCVQIFEDEDSKNISLLMMDIDHFKALNDRFGHDVGDLFLKHLGEELKHFCRKEEQAFRMGGEEFCILMPGISLSSTETAAEHLRSRVEDMQVKTLDGTVVKGTLSIGIAQRLATDSADSWLKRADVALYQAKSNGRNCVRIAGAGLPI